MIQIINYAPDPVNFCPSSYVIKTVKCAYCGEKHDYKLHNIFYKARIGNNTKYFCSNQCKVRFMRERNERLAKEEELAGVYQKGVVFNGKKYRGYKYKYYHRAYRAFNKIDGYKIIKRKGYFILLKEIKNEE